MSFLLAFFDTKLGKYLLIALALIATAFAFGTYERSVGYREGLDVGDQRELAKDKANAKAITALDAKYRDEERAHQSNLDAIGATHAQEIKDAEDRRLRDVADARRGAIRLSVASRCGGSNGSSAPQVGGSAPGGDGSSRTELPPEVTGNLLGLADDADQVARQLSACQRVVESDRANSFPKGKP